MKEFRSTRPRRWWALAFVPLVAVAVMSCTPETTAPSTTTTTPPLKAILSPTSGPAGTYVDVAPPDENCLTPPRLPFSILGAALTIPSSGVVVAQGGVSWSPEPSDLSLPADPFVHLLIPPATPAGTYLVYLTCSTYGEAYAYAPATFTVTPPA